MAKNDVSRLSIGKTGEDIAETFLRSRGYSIIGRNIRTPFGEIDIVALSGRCHVFVEVRTRRSRAYGDAIASLTFQKKKHMIRNCIYYLASRKLLEKETRIDVIGIHLSSRGAFLMLKHIRNALDFSLYLP